MWLTVEEPQLRVGSTKRWTPWQAVAQADFWGKARASSERQEEVPFCVGSATSKWADARITTESWTSCTGSMTAGTVIDYKTDLDPGNTEAQRKYDEQVAVVRVGVGTRRVRAGRGVDCPGQEAARPVVAAGCSPPHGRRQSRRRGIAVDTAAAMRRWRSVVLDTGPSKSSTQILRSVAASTSRTCTRRRPSLRRMEPSTM